MKQIIIITQDRPGILADITARLAEHDVNIEDIQAVTVRKWGLIRMDVIPYDVALHALRDSPYTAVAEDVILVSLEDKPGALAQITRRFSDAAVNVRSVRILGRDDLGCLVALSVESGAHVRELVKDVLVF